MSQILWANNANTTLAGTVSNVATTATLTPGAGALFPAPGAGQIFVATFSDAATGLLNEIVHITNVTGDVVTMVRAQEGTTALAWVAGDLFSNLVTAGTMSALAQAATVQAQSANYVADTGGSVNVYAGVFTPAVTAHVIGMPLRIKAATQSTAAATFNDGAGTLAAVRPGGAPIHPGDILVGGIYTFIYNGINFEVAELAGAAALPAVRQPASVTVPNTGAPTSLLPGLANSSADGLVIVEGRFADAFAGTNFCDVLIVLGSEPVVVLGSSNNSGGGSPGTRTYSGSPLQMTLSGAVSGTAVNVMVYGSGFSI